MTVTLTLYVFPLVIQSVGGVVIGVVKLVIGCAVVGILGSVEAMVVGKIVGQLSSSSPSGHSTVPSQM